MATANGNGPEMGRTPGETPSYPSIRDATFQFLPQCRCNWLASFFLVLLVFLTFSPAFWCGFVYWDDDRLLIGDTPYRSMTPTSLGWMLTTSFAGHFQPLTWLSYWLDFKIWGAGPFGFHLTNVALHAATTVLVFQLALRLFAVLTGRTKATNTNSLTAAAALSAALFACHPLRVESVAWLAERRGVLSSLFFLACVLCYVRYARELEQRKTGVTSSPWKSYVAAVAFCALSLLAKATAMTMAPLLLLLDVYPLGRISTRTEASNPSTRRVLIEKLPFLVLGLAAAGRAVVAQRDAGALYQVAEHDWLARSAQASYGLAFYLWKSLIPTQLTPLYQLPSRAELIGQSSLFCAGLVTTAAVLLIVFRRRVPGLVAASIAYVVLLLPVLGFAQSGPQLVADRYSYLPHIGFAMAAGWMLLASTKSDRRPHLQRTLATLLLLILSSLSFAQTRRWTDALTLWGHAVRISPQSSIARVNLADALAKQGRFTEAEEHYLAGLALAPADAIAHHHLADLFQSTGRPAAAIDAYQRVLALAPTRWRAAVSLSELLIDAGRVTEAVPILITTAERNPTAVELLDFLAQLLSTFPDPSVRNGPAAVSWAQKACAIDPVATPQCLLTLSSALAAAGRHAEAITTGEKGLALARASGDAILAAELERRLSALRMSRTPP